MQSLSVCFVGVGSIARRHIRNLRAVCARRGIQLVVDAFRRSSGAPAEEGVDHMFCLDDGVPCSYDAVFITNPTAVHLDALRRFHSRGRHFFIEKPVSCVHQLAQLGEFERHRGSAYYVACPLRYHAAIQYVKRNIAPQEVLSVRSISSSYLPEWRPGQDYRATYSAHKSLGGGVSIDLVHEWDYLVYLFGWPQKVYSLVGKKSPLEVDSDDYAAYIADYADKAVELHLDYFGRKATRQVELYMRDDTVICDLVNCRVSYLVSGEVVDFQEGRDDYQQRELGHFLDMVSGAAPPEDSLLHSARVLELTQGRLPGGRDV